MSDLIRKQISLIAMQNRQIITKLLCYESNLIVDAEERKTKGSRGEIQGEQQQHQQQYNQSGSSCK